MFKRFLSLLAIALVSVCWILPAPAQDEDNEGVAELVLITPKPGQGEALEEAIREYHHWVADKPGHFRYDWYVVETGPNTGKYAARSGNHNWAEFDQEFDWEEEAAAKFEAEVLPLIDHFERYLTAELKEFAYWPEDFSEYTLFQVENWYIKSGQYGNWQAGVERIHKALTEAEFGQHYGFNRTVSGGKGNEVTIVLPMKGYADFAEQDPSFVDILTQALGGAEAFGEFMGDWGSTFDPGEAFLVRLLPEASDYGDAE